MKELQYEKRCLMASLAIFVELQKNDKNIIDYLKDCKKQYLESRHAAEVIEDNDDSETHLHIHALVSLFKIISKQKSIQSDDLTVKNINAILGEFMYQEYKKCLYISGVDTLRDLIEDLVSKQEKMPNSTRFFLFLLQRMGTSIMYLSHILYLMNL